MKYEEIDFFKIKTKKNSKKAIEVRKNLFFQNCTPGVPLKYIAYIRGIVYCQVVNRRGYFAYYLDQITLFYFQFLVNDLHYRLLKTCFYPSTLTLFSVESLLEPYPICLQSDYGTLLVLNSALRSFRQPYTRKLQRKSLHISSSRIYHLHRYVLAKKN